MESLLPLDQFLTNHARSVRAILCFMNLTHVNADLLRMLPALELVVTPTTGVNHIDLTECKRRGIAIANAGDAYFEDVADSAVGLFIDLRRRLAAANRYMRQSRLGIGSQINPPIGYKVDNELGLLGWEASAIRLLEDLRPSGALSLTTQEEKSHAYHTPSTPTSMSLHPTVMP